MNRQSAVPVSGRRFRFKYWSALNKNGLEMLAVFSEFWMRKNCEYLKRLYIFVGK
jgi:hypothetical protein